MEVSGVILASLLLFNYYNIRFHISLMLDSWRERWVDSTHKSDYGEFKLTAGEFYGDAEKDKGSLAQCSVCILKCIIVT